MKRFIIAFVTLGILIISSSFSPATMKAQDIRSLDKFSKIGISIHAEVFYTPGDKHEIRLEGDERDIEKLITEVQDGDLNIRYKTGYRQKSKLKLHITSKSLEDVRLSGSGTFYSEKKVNTPKMYVAISGSGTVTFDELVSEKVKARISGSGDIMLNAGSASMLGVQISGSGKVKAEHFEAGSLDAATSGSGSIWITVTEDVNYKSSGSGSLYYHGDPRVNSVSSGSGKIRAL